MRQIFSFVIVAILILGSFYFFLQKPAPAKYQDLTLIQIGETELQVRLAETDAEHRQGLSNTKSLADGEGMLFIYEKPAKQSFWMKDMNYSLDIIWIDERNRVIGVEKNVSPDTFPLIFSSPGEVKYVLEVPAGFSNRSNIEIGQILNFRHR